jgi:hypothetical protein
MKLIEFLDLPRCPYCHVDKPNLTMLNPEVSTADKTRQFPRFWRTYSCRTCGGVVVAASPATTGEVTEWYPRGDETVDDAIPARAGAYLTQARQALHTPDSSVMTSGSAVDAMLKAKNYKDGSLYSRIDAAAKANIITPDMAAWAHDVRLDANDQRHADEDAPMASHADAVRCLDFAVALAEILFVLPARVQRGMKKV